MRQLFTMLAQALTIAIIVLLTVTLARGDSLGPHAAFAAALPKSPAVSTLAPALVELGDIEAPSSPASSPRWATRKARARASRVRRPEASPPAAVCSPDAPDLCKDARDCKGPVPDGARWTCVRPWWASSEIRKGHVTKAIKVCAFGWAIGVAKPGRHPGPGTWRRQGQDRTRAELELVVATQCRGHGCDRSELSTWLGVLAMRESSLRPWVTHRLSGDERANSSAWAKLAEDYIGNPHYKDAERWRGRGLLGQIAAYYVKTIDALAAPEELCDPAFATISYLQHARAIAGKQRSLGMQPTWASVAATIGTGAMRPSTKALALVRARLHRAGLDPDARISSASFGRPLPAGGAGKGGWAAVTAARSVLAAARTSRRLGPPSS